MITDKSQIFLCIACVILTLFITCIAPEVEAGDVQDPLLLEVVSGYQRSANLTPSRISFQATDDVLVRVDGTEKEHRESSNVIFKKDGPRIETITGYNFYDSHGNIVDSRSSNIHSVFDRQYLSFQSLPVAPQLGFITVQNNSESGTQRAEWGLGEGRALDGYLSANTISFNEIIKNSDLRLLEQQEEIEGNLSYAIEAQTLYGEHKFWLDPTVGYLPRRVEVHKEKGDLLFNGPLSDFTIENDDNQRIALARYDVIIDSIKYLKIGEVNYPTQARIITKMTYSDGRIIERERHHKRLNIDVDPNFDLLVDFRIFAPEGTRVYHENYPSILYEWRGNKIIPLVDEQALDDIEKIVGDIVQGNSIAQNGESQSAPSDAEPEEVSSSPLPIIRISTSKIFFFSGVVSFVLMATAIFLYRRSRIPSI